MALKWTGILVTVVAVTFAVTANVLTDNADGVPAAVNLIVVAVAAAATVVAVVAHLQERVDRRLDQLFELMVSRFDQLDAETGDRNAGFVEGYLVGHAPEGSVVPMTPRGKRAFGGHHDSRRPGPTSAD